MTGTRKLVALCMGLLLSAWTLHAQPAKPGSADGLQIPPGKPVQLADKPWADPGYGLGMQIPEKVKLVRQTADGRLMSFQTMAKPYFLLNMEIYRAEKIQDFREVFDGMIGDLLRTKTHLQLVGKRELQCQPFEVVTEQQVRGQTVKEVSRITWPCRLAYFRAPVSSVGRGKEVSGIQAHLMGLAVVQILPRTYVVIRTMSDWRDAGQVAATLEAMLKTLNGKNARRVAERRRKAIEQMRSFLSQLKAERLHASLIDRQYFQIQKRMKVNDDTEQWVGIGVMSVVQQRSEQLGRPGVLVRVESYSAGELDQTRISAEMFCADDQSYESWQLYQRILTPRRIGGLEQVETRESGVRNFRTIRVIHEGDQQSKPLTFVTPPGYVSQAYAWLLPQLLPKNRPYRYGYYWYDPVSAKVVYREEQVMPLGDRYRVRSTVSHNGQLVSATYDRQGRLMDRSLSLEESTTREPITRMIPTTRQVVQNHLQIIEQSLKQINQPPAAHPNAGTGQ